VYDEDTNHITILSNKEDLGILDFPKDTPLALLTQTTLSIDDTKELSDLIKIKFPHIVTPPAGDICYATTNRQNAVKKLAEVVDTVFVIGSKNSSNSAKLKLTAEKL
jgi:4-hydroxy-3-methylbut-2-en-1-yl diphosphate reductase